MESFLLKKDWPPGRQTAEAGKEEKPDACQHPEGNSPNRCAQRVFIYRLLWLLRYFVIHNFTGESSGCLVPLICVAMNLCMIFLLSCHLAVKSCLTLATPRTVAHQAPLSKGFSRQERLPWWYSRQEYWHELPFSSPGDLPDPGGIYHWVFLTHIPIPLQWRMQV